MGDIQVIHHDEQPTAGIREQVAISDLPEFFARALDDTMVALWSRGLNPIGPAFAKYYGPLRRVVDVEAGFPVAVAITQIGDVNPGTLPGGRVVETVHLGSHEMLHQTYSGLEHYFTDAGLMPGSVVWESYLSDAATEPDPKMWRTRICWPVSEPNGA
jgi:effector-binding domain-containing protein